MKKISLLMIAALFLTGCTADSEPIKVTRDVFAMDTYMQLTAYGESAESAVNEAELTIQQLEGLFSVTNTDSDLSRINNADGQFTDVSHDTAELIEFAKDMCSQTSGALDITVYPILREWGFTTGEYKIPDDETIAQLLENMDYSQIRIDGDSVCIPENFNIDLGAVAKGYTSDKVIECFKENDVNSGIISLGGNVYALGKKSDGSLWSVGIIDPFSPDKNMCILSVSDKAVITSGNYERYFIGDDGKRYCHIIDPMTGKPSENGLVSVTIIGASGAECDALSTALFVMGKDKAIEYYKNKNDFDMVLVSDQREIFYTSGIADLIENVSEMPSEEIT